MFTRKSTSAWLIKSHVVAKAITVGAPRVDREFTGRSSSESNSKSIGARLSGCAETPTTGAGCLLPPHPTAHAETTTPAKKLFALLPNEAVLSIGEEDVERGECSVTLRHVLLHLHFFFVA